MQGRNKDGASLEQQRRERRRLLLRGREPQSKDKKRQQQGREQQGTEEKDKCMKAEGDRHQYKDRRKMDRDEHEDDKASPS